MMIPASMGWNGGFAVGRSGAGLTVLLILAVRVAAAQDASAPLGGVLNVGQGQREALKVSEAIYQATGFSNTFLVRTPEGNVIIDTSNAIVASRHRQLLQAVDAGPVQAIILTHGHPDHTGGVNLWRGPDTKLIVQRNFIEFIDYQRRLGDFFQSRNAAQFGGAVAGRRGGDWSGGRDGDLTPDVAFGDHYVFELGGITFECFATPGETYDQLTVWIPQYKAAFVGDNFYDSFPNIYTLRGTQPRWALDYVRSVEKVMSLGPEILLPSHGSPRTGNTEIMKQLIKYRDAILYVHDATVKGMNEGKDVFTLMREVRLPPELEVGEGYGKVSWSVRGIFEGYVGWFDGNPASMYEQPAAAAYPDLVKLAGGSAAVAARAEALVSAGEELKGLHLADIALAAEPGNPAALRARLAALDGLLAKCRNSNERGWLTYGIQTTKAKMGAEAR
jgi:alkyl sulfatase BDS1-like metallo-beta-lactamase superfamily hydrolase